jgi:putative membrane protein
MNTELPKKKTMGEIRELKTANPKADRVAIPIIVVLSVLVPVAVALLILFPDTFRLEMGIDRGTLPAFHAILNGTTALLLLSGLYFIMKKNIAAHRFVMMAAFGLSAVFLVSYVISKLNAEPIPYGGEGFIRGLYFFILISHILLSIPVLPLAMLAIYRGLTQEYAKHRKLVRYTFPIWLYVAVTGVLVYLFMQPYY